MTGGIRGPIALGVSLAVFLFAAMIIVGVYFGQRQADDKDGLIAETKATVIDVVEDSHDSPAREDLDTDEGYKVVYRYELDGRTYFESEWFNDHYWTPNDALGICYDEGDPGRHAPYVGPVSPCGTDQIVRQTRVASDVAPAVEDVR